MNTVRPTVMRVDACLRDGAGGSPTTVVLNAEQLTDDDLCAMATRFGTSHVAAVTLTDGAEIRFSTAAGPLPNCGHGTVAAIAALADSGRGSATINGRPTQYRTAQRPNGLVEAWFDQGEVTLRSPASDEIDDIATALGLTASDRHPESAPIIASPGRERLLLPVRDASVLARLQPDMDQLREATDRHRQLGCFAYVPPSDSQPASARMFAPSIGVPEDIANANSTGCLAAHLLAAHGLPEVVVHQGDSLGHPSAVHATASATDRGARAWVGGTARFRREAQRGDNAGPP